MENNELNHAGIKGMKWGVRRYQNKDGSLTPEGRKRYADSNDDFISARSKSIQNMSDTELTKALNRVRMEQQYKELTKVEKSAGRKWLESTLANIGSQVATKIGTAAATAGIGAILNKAGASTNSKTTKAFTEDMLKGIGVPVRTGEKKKKKE